LKALLIVGSGEFLASACSLALRQQSPFQAVEVHTTDGFTFSTDAFLADFTPADVQVFIAIDARAVNTARARLIDTLAETGYAFTNLIAPDSYVSESARIGGNVYIGPGCHLLDNTYIGDGSWLDAAVLVDRGAAVERCSTLGVGVTIGEASTIGQNSTLSAGSHVTPKAKVGQYCEWLLGGKLPYELPDRSFFDASMPQGARIIKGKRTW
jgi:UDP-3-O-[3-hydroxymyristoyl] glucosamine N-acyltransferase